MTTNNKYKIERRRPSASLAGSLGRGARLLAGSVFSLLLCTACSDEWNDHYDNATVSKEGSLWTAISNEAQLSNFAKVAQACGYDRILNGYQTYSVYAPTNSHFTETQADSLIALYNEQLQRGFKGNDNAVVRQFLQNHIAPYKHPVSSLTNDSLVMLNGKYTVVTPTTIGGQQLLSSNDLYDNGVLFTLDNRLAYFPNVFEYLSLDTTLSKAYEFIDSYSKHEFDEAKSVPGGYVDGKTVYLDSVTTFYNPLFRRMYAQINHEDSTYVMVVPTNAEWDRLVEKYTPYFNYANDVENRDSLQYANTRMAILQGSIFSRTINPEKSFADSAYSTMSISYAARKLLGVANNYTYIYRDNYAPGGIFDGTQPVTCSNGTVHKADNFNFHPTSTFMQTIKVEAEYLVNQDTIVDGNEPVTTRKISTTSPFYDKVSGNAYIEVVPSNPSSNPKITFKINPDNLYGANLLSGVKYNIYAVTVPAIAYDAEASEEDRLPNRLRVYVTYGNQKGTVTTRSLITAATAQPDVVDTVLLKANYVFETCTQDLEKPKTRLQVESNVSRTQTTQYSRTLRLDCLLFVPQDDEGNKAKELTF